MNAPSEQTVRRLFALSNNKCAFPQCSVSLFEPSGTRLGEICHINAQSRGGPRFDETQSDEERHSFGNLILLCANHHQIIDTEPERFTLELLHEIKSLHERGGRNEVTTSDDCFAKVLLDFYLKKSQSTQCVNSPGAVIIEGGVRQNGVTAKWGQISLSDN